MLNSDTFGPLFPILGRLLSDPLDSDEAGRLLRQLAAAGGWANVGLLWPLQSPVRFALPEGESADLPDNVVATLRGGDTVETAGRIYARMPVVGRRDGAVFLERQDGRWGNDQKAMVSFLGRLLGRSAFLDSREELGINQDRLMNRLSDSSVIAGRIAHDFDNILTGILGFSDLTAGMLPADSQAKGFVQEISKVGQRGITFTDQLHQLSRSGQARPRSGSVAKVLATEAARIGPNLSLDVSDDLPDVGMEPEPLKVVLAHILDNAVEACSKSPGSITATARFADFSPAEVETFLGSLKPGPAVEVTVRDGGEGMPPVTFGRIFVEPFHTTKVRHRGLGLAIAYRILQAHGGGIRIESAEGKGTTVWIALPPSRY